MTEPLDRLRIGLAADEDAAVAASPHTWRTDVWHNQHDKEFLVVADMTPSAPAFAICNEANAEHIARQDPRTTLRRVELVRAVIGLRAAAAEQLARNKAELAEIPEDQPVRIMRKQGYVHADEKALNAYDRVIEILASVYEEEAS